MHSSTIILAFAALAAAAPLPLNINLGAYSPALVVGDGAIEIEGAANAAPQLINSLQGAAVGGAQAASVAEPAAVQQAQVAGPGILSEPAALPSPGQSKELDPRVGEAAKAVKREEAPVVKKRQLGGFDRALRYAEAALVKGPKVQMGTGGAAGIGLIVDNNQVAAAAPNTEH